MYYYSVFKCFECLPIEKNRLFSVLFAYAFISNRIAFYHLYFFVLFWQNPEKYRYKKMHVINDFLIVFLLFFFTSFHVYIVCYSLYIYILFFIHGWFGSHRIELSWLSWVICSIRILAISQRRTDLTLCGNIVANYRNIHLELRVWIPMPSFLLGPFFFIFVQFYCSFIIM